MSVFTMVDLSNETSSDGNDDVYLPQIKIGSSSSSQDESQGSKNEDTDGKATITAKAAKKSLIEERKFEKEERKKERNMAIQNNKIYKPGECMKHMFVEMHAALLETWYCADISRELAAVGAHLRSSSTLCTECSSVVLWSRSIDPILNNVGGMVELGASEERCDRGLYISQAEDVATHVQAHTLSSHMATVEDLAGCKLTLVVFGVKDYFKPSGRKTNNSSRKLITEIEFEMAITDLLVSAQIDTLLVNTSSELALAVVQFTKAIAEEPYKIAKRAFDEQAGFYMKGDNKKCVCVDKDGNGVSRLWQQMVAMLPLSSLPTARALAVHYPTPRALYESLQAPGGVEVVAAAGVDRAVGGGARPRAVGPQLARKLHALLTADDGDLLTD